MAELYKFTVNAFNWLSKNAGKNTHMYKDPKADFEKLLRDNISEYRESTGITIKDGIDLTPPDGYKANKSHLADLRALDFYASFDGMTPRLATDHTILAYINHFYLHEYGIKRWPLAKNGNFEEHVKDHWLTGSNATTKIWKASISGRTWWIARVALEAAKASNGAFTPKQALGVFSSYPEYYHRTMEYTVLRSPTLLAECVRSLRTDPGAKGVNRSGYVAMARELNREGSARLLDSLRQSDIRELVGRAADKVMCRPEFVTDRRYLRGAKKYKVLSLGAGTQSTVMALMAEEGWQGMEKPDIAIFADTQWEPPYVYSHLDWLEKQLSYKVIRVSAGNIRENVLSGVTPAGDKFLDMPVYLVNKDGTHAIAARQCTTHYKIKPIHKELRKILKLEPGKRAPKNIQVEMWMGISSDESHRMRPSRDEWITNRFPLVERDLSRAQLHDWFKKRYPERQLPRSACIGCPYHTDMEWKWIKENDPESFQDAVFIDRAIREIPAIRGSLKGTGYLHKSRNGLDGAGFDGVENYEEYMASECEGLCGV